MENGRTGGGEAGNGLKQTVNVRAELVGEPEGQRPEDAQQHPNQAHGEKALPGKKGAVGPDEEPEAESYRDDDGNSLQKGERVLVVKQCHEQGDQQRRGFHQQGGAGDADDQLEIHGQPPIPKGSA